MQEIIVNRRTVTRAAAVTGVTVGMAAAGFFGGQATRMSDTARASERGAAVAVVASRDASRAKHDATAARDELHRSLRGAAKKAHRHEVARIHAMRKVERKRAARLAREGTASGYANGSSAGYSSGHSSGVQDGLEEGSDDLTCSDDLSVTWLPYCDD